MNKSNNKITLNRKQIIKMSPEEQRITIAEAAGWTWVTHEDWLGTWVPHDDWLGAKGWGWELKGASLHTCDYYRCEKELAASCLPDYLNDLNAMREAEKVLTKDKRTQLVNVLLRVVIKDLDRNTPILDKLRVLYYASAAQRAEAFLKIIHKWTTNEPTEP